MPNMMRCPYCGEEIDMSEEPIFCEYCGKDLLCLDMNADPIPEPDPSQVYQNPNPVSEQPFVTPVTLASSMPNETEQVHSPAPTDFGKPAMAAPKEYHYVK